MTQLDQSAAPPIRGRAPDRRRQAQGRAVRRAWRIHFYAALFSAPFLVLLAVTGLVILYTAPISEALHGGLLKVTPSTTVVSFDQQRAAAASAFPDLTVDMVVPPSAPDRSTMVELTDGADLYQQVYVNPYTGAVLGSRVSGDDVIGLANRLHGWLAADDATVSLPSLNHLVDPDSPSSVDIRVGDIIIEVAALWGLVLAVTGVFLWWPRSSQKGKPLMRVRWGKGGRIRWRDLHVASGMVLAAVLAFFVLSGMPWSTYWGSAWATVASKVTPNDAFDAPTSTSVKAGDLDRLGHRIPWATRTETIPASGDPATVAPAAMSLDSVVSIARQEGMLPGYSILLPTDDTADTAAPVYGTYQLSNAWPGRVEDERVVYLDQFTGSTLAESNPTSWGFLGRATEWGVQNHMGTQYGLASKVLMTLGCLLTVLSVVTGGVMWWKRRPRGGAGLPKRSTREASRASTIAVLGVALVLGVIYPLWGVTALLILGADAAVGALRRSRPSRTARV
jgi:uncharacterized iron-regulated membrane protein